jgi:Ca2+-binding RTX toxin-like protein
VAFGVPGVSNPGNNVIYGGADGDRGDIFEWGGSDPVVADLNLETAEGGGHLNEIHSIHVLLGYSGDDTLIGDELFNSLEGGKGDDHIEGRGGADEIIGDFGNDTLDGGDGADSVVGREGDDSLTGGEGDDVLLGGDGTDVLDGGNGTDGCVDGETVLNCECPTVACRMSHLTRFGSLWFFTRSVRASGALFAR